MPREARRRALSGFYHVIVRGVGKQILFEDDFDRMRFIKTLEQYSTETEVVVSAYCLMENHVHLLVFERQNGLSVMMKKIGVSYSEYFNKKYERTGHLFQDRYLSEPVETEQYLLTVFRYILNNPVKAGISTAEQYPWSSYAFYGRKDSFVDTKELCKRIGTWEDYKAFISAEQSDECMEFEPRKHDDTWALKIIQDEFHVESGTEVQQFSRQERNKAVLILLEKGLSIRQIERMTGISRGIIQKMR